jgi:hypothetical protein
LNPVNTVVSILDAEINVLRFVQEGLAKNRAKLCLNVGIHALDFAVKNVLIVVEINFVKTMIKKHLKYFLEMNRMMMYNL